MDQPVTTTRPPSLVAGCLLAVALALSGCGANAASGTDPTATASAERTVTELAPTAAPSITEPAAPVPAADPGPGPSGPRPDNGATIVERGKSGRGELAIDNGTDQDALVTLSMGGKAVRAVYVRASANTDLRGIADGTYDIFVAQGDGWNRELHRFTDSPDYSKFAETAPFKTEKESGGIRYTRLSITLQPVVNGNVSTEPVGPGAYPT